MLFTRTLRLRNFAGLPFWVSASPGDCARIVERARTLAAARGHGEAHRLADLSANARGVLRERELLPEYPGAFEGKRDFKHLFAGAPFDPSRAGPRACVLTGEAEHWIEVEVSPGLAAAEDLHGAREASSYEDVFSRSASYGFLTSDPGFTGLGLRLEAGLHLPGLAATGGMAPARRALGALGFELRPLATRLAGFEEAGFFRLVSRGGLGLTETEARERFRAKVSALNTAEVEALEAWRARDPGRFEDGAHRAAALLRGAQRAGHAELLAWISRVRAGRRAGLDLGPGLSGEALEALRVRAQPHHLATEPSEPSPGEAVGEADEAVRRARLARVLLG